MQRAVLLRFGNPARRGAIKSRIISPFSNIDASAEIIN